MELSVSISLPYLWNGDNFNKNDWGSLNFLVGPNGTGKTLFAQQLKQICSHQGLKVRYLNAERLSGLEKENYGNMGRSNLESGFNIGYFNEYKSQCSNYGLSADSFVFLKEKPDIKIKIEAVLSQFFERDLILKEENGFLKPKILKNNDKKEYDMKTSECHGLKELITLLSLLYNDEYNCLIIDEPELHLHPQFQAYFLQEIRKIAGDPRIDPSRKCFFLITHSPYFIDIKTIDDLKNCLVFQPNKCPRFIHELETDDYARVNHLLPRLNTHHKQFFFASRPIFVEGYSDQQLFALIQEKRGRFLGASGSCIIDINGKDELDLFYKICSNLNIDGQYICDLDALFHGKLRQSLSLDSRCKKHLQDQGLDIDLMKAIGLLETKIGECLTDLESSLEKTTEFSEPIAALSQTLKEAKGDKLLATKRYIFLIALLRMRSELECLIPDKRDHLNFILSRSQKLIEVLKKCGFFLLPQGALENYLPSYKGNPYKIPENDKKDIFEQERRFIIDTDLSDEDFISRYGEVISILDQASLSKKINLDVQLNYVISEWIHRVQMAHRRNSSLTIESIKEDLTLEWTKYLRIFELIDFSANQSEFKCKIKLKPSIDPLERAIEFDNKCVAANFVLN